MFMTFDGRKLIIFLKNNNSDKIQQMSPKNDFSFILIFTKADHYSIQSLFFQSCFRIHS